MQITISEIKEAIEKAKGITGDWQAECIEVLLIPKVMEFWKSFNKTKGRNLDSYTVGRHIAEKYDAMECMSAYAKGRWSIISGYTLTYYKTAAWNSVRDEWYSHSASCCWRGISETNYSMFIEALRQHAYGYIGLADVLVEAGIDLVFDEPLMLGGGQVDNADLTWDEWADTYFEAMKCNCCGKDKEDHTPALAMGYWFAQCKKEAA